MKKPPFTDDELTAELLRQHNFCRWPPHPIILPDGPMRKALRAAGLIETYKPHSTALHQRIRWRMTAAGRERLVNLPGSGITRDEPR